MEHFHGFLTADATIKLVNNHSVVNFRVARNRKYVKDGKTHTKTQFIDCAWWGPTAVSKYLKRGILVIVEGDLDAQAYNKKSTGEAVAQLTCRIQQCEWYKTVKKEAETEADGEQFVAPPPTDEA